MKYLEDIRADITFALRQLRRSPAFTLVATGTLALGIGANSAIFALVDAALLRPLPFRDPDQLVMVWERSPRSQRGAVAPLNMRDWNEQSRTFELLAGFAPGVGGMVMAGADGTAETVPRQWVTSGFFDVLGIRPVTGRTFLASDDAQRANAVVLSEAFWRTRFTADPSIVGTAIRLDGDPFTVVGIVPADFQLLGRTGMWALRSFDANPAFRTAYQLAVIGRMRPGVKIDAARADMQAVAEGLARAYPQSNSQRSVTIEPLREALVGSDLRRTAMLFLGVVGFVLLICCANVANLVLARATARTRELATRAALGAGRERVARQLVTESLVLAALGGIAGLAVGAVILRAAPTLIPQALLPGAVTLTFDARVVVFCAGATLFVGMLFGLVPAARATGLSSAGVLAADSRTTVGGGKRIRSALVVAEVATAVVLLCGAGLLLRTLLAVDRIDRGYRAESVLTMIVDPLGSRYPTAASLEQFFQSIEHEIRGIPGVADVGWASTLPLGDSYAGRSFFEVVGDAPLDENRRPTADHQIVSAAYFATLDLPIVAGRAFNERDTRTNVAVCIVNEAFVRHYLQGRPPVGTRVAMRRGPQAQPVIREIVGVARQVKARPDETQELIQIYVPITQNIMDDMFLLVRPFSGPAEALAGSVRAAIGRVDKEQLVSVREVMTLEDVTRDATGRHRFRAVLVVTFAVLALLLAVIGVFGLLAYSVQQRLRDFALRRALGATTHDVMRIVIGNAAQLVVTGVVIGLIVSAFATRLITAMLFGVEPLDPITFAAVTIVLAVTTAISAAAPAVRATRIDPAVALRSQ
jgi:putative ABC transport system permease protein